MTAPRTADNTRSALSVLFLTGAALTLIALLLGLSDKPDIEAIGIVVPGAVGTVEAVEAPVASAPVAVTQSQADASGSNAVIQPDAPVGQTESAPAQSAQVDPAGGTETNSGDGTVAADEAVPSFEEAPAPQAQEAQPADSAIDAGTDGGAAAGETVGDAASATTSGAVAAPTLAPVATPEPTATPEVAAAVEPTLIPASGDDGDDDDDSAARALATGAAPVSAGTYSGQFFTKGQEDEGASVERNEIILTINDDGTGTFVGRLDITLVDETNIMIDVAGPMRWTNENPQVLADIGGSFVVAAGDDLSDMSATEAELKISSFRSGSGSLCASQCFGFRYPPPAATAP